MLLRNFKKMSVLTCLLYFISMALNFAPMMSKITITRGMDVTRHPWWISFVLSLLLLIMIIYTEFLSYKKLRHLVFSLIISLLLGILFFLEWLFISYNNNPAFVSFLSVGYLSLYLLYGRFTDFLAYLMQGYLLPAVCLFSAFTLCLTLVSSLV